MKRCLTCMGKGYVPIEGLSTAERLQMFIEQQNMHRNGEPVAICFTCRGCGFLNPIFRSEKYFNIGKSRARRTR